MLRSVLCAPPIYGYWPFLYGMWEPSRAQSKWLSGNANIAIHRSGSFKKRSPQWSKLNATYSTCLRRCWCSMDRHLWSSMLFFATLNFDQRLEYCSRVRSSHFDWYAIVWRSSWKYLVKTIKCGSLANKSEKLHQVVTGNHWQIWYKPRSANAVSL